MSLGTVPLIGAEAPRNLTHVILDNEAYESTGGQPSISSGFDLTKVAEGAGYRTVARADGVEGLQSALLECARSPGPHLILVKAGIAPVKGIPRVSHSPTDIRDWFKSSVHAGD